MCGRGFLVFSEDTNKTEQEFTGVTLWGVFRALKQVNVTGKVTSYSTRYACVPLHWCGGKREVMEGRHKTFKLRKVSWLMARCYQWSFL